MEPRYRIFLDVSTDEHIESFRLVWEGSDQQQAEEAFSDYCDLDTYATECAKYPFNGDNTCLWPLLLVENVDGGYDVLDRFNPAIILNDESFDISDIEDNANYAEISTLRRSWIIFPDRYAAGEIAASYWSDMARNDPREFAAIIGEDRLVQWALGGYDEFGISSLVEFLEVVASNPAEHLATYDGNELYVTGVSLELRNMLGFTPTVAYRTY